MKGSRIFLTVFLIILVFASAYSFLLLYYNNLNIVKTFLYLLYKNDQFLSNIPFFFVPKALMIFSLSLGILTFNAYFNYKKSIQYKIVLKAIFILYLALSSCYTFGLFDTIYNIKKLNIIEWGIVVFGIFAPICILVVGKIILNFRIRGHKIFNYTTLWVIYIIIALIWEFLYPGEIMFVCIGVYCVMNAILLYYCLAKGGGKEDE